MRFTLPKCAYKACQKRFVSSHKKQIYCSNLCRHKSWMAKKRSEGFYKYICSNYRKKQVMETYDNLLKKQEGKCAICKKDQSENKGRRFAYDHNHTTGKFRGLLCSNCNLMIGLSGDNPEILKNSIDYLERYSNEKKAT